MKSGVKSERKETQFELSEVLLLVVVSNNSRFRTKPCLKNSGNCDLIPIISLKKYLLIKKTIIVRCINSSFYNQAKDMINFLLD